MERKKYFKMKIGYFSYRFTGMTMALFIPVAISELPRVLDRREETVISDGTAPAPVIPSTSRPSTTSSGL